MEMSEIIAQAQCLTKEALDVKNYILKTGKITSRLCNFAVFIVIVTPFFFVAKMYIIGAICCLFCYPKEMETTSQDIRRKC